MSKPPYKTLADARDDGWLLFPSAFPTKHNYYFRDGEMRRRDELTEALDDNKNSDRVET